MIKAISSMFLGFVFVFLQGAIVLKLKNYSTLDFGSIQLFMVFWAANFCYVFSVISKIETWFENKYNLKLFTPRE